MRKRCQVYVVQKGEERLHVLVYVQAEGGWGGKGMVACDIDA